MPNWCIPARGPGDGLHSLPEGRLQTLNAPRRHLQDEGPARCLVLGAEVGEVEAIPRAPTRARRRPRSPYCPFAIFIR